MVSGISIVIPNFNGRKLLEEVIPTILEALVSIRMPWEIIVSDDCSTDDSLAFLKASYPTIRTCAASVNAGFSPTINRGIAIAVHSHVLLLNSDVKLTPGYFESQLPYFDSEDTFGVMGRIVGWDNDVIQDGGKYPVFHGLKLKTSGNFLPPDSAPSGHRYYSSYLSGANALVDRKKLLQMGAFDELFAPFYIEDVDLSIRAWRLGWKCYYEHSSVCRHKTSTSIKSSRSRKMVRTIYDRNKMYLHAIHFPTRLRYQWFVQLGMEGFLRLITFNLAWLSALLQFSKNYQSVRRSRQKLAEAAQGRPLIELKQAVESIQSSLDQAGVKRF